MRQRPLQHDSEAEVLIHGRGASCEYLHAIGVRLSYGKSRIGGARVTRVQRSIYAAPR
ncbi:MAG: hypothetical protein ACXV2E_09450 [Halobacteriota archaeon]